MVSRDREIAAPATSTGTTTRGWVPCDDGEVAPAGKSYFADGHQF
jgi:hypothetical protein